eukprot:CAMPEP_0115526760 /NCGR_PEP_ID=MMETSP0271-20121206/82480_1 /TAXON_ID=71861 /ORGANISM="Scrippsiella trochoidea, Strain CCMP3099" /LENGTH=56 /DNA_ID=CAMNT_0002958537 /DNA_START=1 /DNA_END=168 /DNA_ORIENTATION=+
MMVSINFCNLTRRNKRKDRITLTTRKDFPMRAMAGALPSSPNQATKSDEMTSKSNV